MTDQKHDMPANNTVSDISSNPATQDNAMTTTLPTFHDLFARIRNGKSWSHITNKAYVETDIAEDTTSSEQKVPK
jgi:hypothetical protein